MAVFNSFLFCVPRVKVTTPCLPVLGTVWIQCLPFPGNQIDYKKNLEGQRDHSADLHVQEIIEQTSGPRGRKVNYTQINYIKKIEDFSFCNMVQNL